MKLTDEALTKMVLEEINRLDEKTVILKDLPDPAASNLKLPAQPFKAKDSAHQAADQSWEKYVSAIRKALKIGNTKLRLNTTKDIKNLQQAVVASALLGADGDITTLSAEDIKTALKKSPVQAYKLLAQIAAKTKIPSLKNDILNVMKDDPNLPAGYKGEISKIVGADTKDIDYSKDVESYTFPRVMNSTANITGGKFLSSENLLVNTIFSEGTISGRLEKMAKVSESIFTLDPNKLSPRELLQHSSFLDMCNYYLNEMDNRGQGYAFEALCAMICGGKVVGGDNGVADFVAAGGTEGSSKFYKGWSNIQQSASPKAWKKRGDGTYPSVHYVMALHEKAKVNEDDDLDARKTISIDLCYAVINLVKIEKNAQGEAVGYFQTTDANGNRLGSGGQAVVMKPNAYVNVIAGFSQSDASVGTLTLYKGNNSFIDVLDKNLQAGDPKEAFNSAKKLFMNLLKAEQSTKDYINAPADDTKLEDKANAALRFYDAVDADLVKVLEALQTLQSGSGSQKKVTGQKGSRKLKENEKLTEELLDKLIKAVIL